MENTALFNLVQKKGSLKQNIYHNTCAAFQEFRTQAKALAIEYGKYEEDILEENRVELSYADKGDFEFEIKFGGDVLLFMMHSNVFEIPRNHEIMKTPYIGKDKARSYGGLIHIYNFLADSFKYGRENDAGYLIGRIMVNKENHYFIEGKKEIGMIYHNFESSVLDQKAIAKIISSSIEYTVNFDLLVPPYEKVTYISVVDILRRAQSNGLSTGKRLGFKFQADEKEIKGQLKDD
ncbi:MULTISPECIES: hypothetical protein [unclassified Lentimicrobium]|uniref:hypothetical protein n=1 Tax=unclassified Lentimicrobium TaxID=2677434 RepID=UPI001555D130|nr:MULTISPECIES: hypothetical protein [unclassified Lentimicrobium]NPD45210.1 hypothetical protein [Lentimicrobium sp. S6]NPD86580.1 hypothetical protein [Lentimicrobium sp. L6]